MLQDLNKLRESLTQKYLLTFWDEDRDLPEEFKTQATNIETTSITYNEGSFILTSGSGLKIYFPNQLWAIAAYFAEYYKAIEEYSEYIKTVLNLEKEDIKSCVNNENKTKNILNRFPDITDENRKLLVKFLSDYKWWGGGKTIDRQDYYYSPIISLCGLVNASQGFVAELCKYLASNNAALALLEEENERIAASHPKRLVVSAVLSDFCVEVTRYLYENGLIKELVSYASYSDCSLLGDGGRKIKIATPHGSLTGLLLTLGANTLNNRSDKERWNETPINFDEKEAYISNQWCAPAGHQLTLVDLQNVLDDVYPSQFSIKEDKGIFYLYSGKEIYEQPKITRFQSPHPLQQIFYGAPGTGKSHTIDKETNESNRIRTTFHPDYDYATFVGAYKPTVKTVDKYGLFGKDTVVMKHENNTPIKEDVIVYKFIPQAFIKAYVEAWRRYVDAECKDRDFYLVIEEINRGNCAQIFGDLFQLLDRTNAGFSSYAVETESDLQSFLTTDEEYKLDIVLTEDIKNDKGKVIATAENVMNGKVLVLPPNLHIWATMNTSDQSLFPIDSAFKRRWDWKYVPIKYDNTDWKVMLDNEEVCKWTELQQVLNDLIYDATESEDKMLGDWFVKADDNIISEEVLVGKIIFYLWNDVAKVDAGKLFDLEVEKNGRKRKVIFSDFYKIDGNVNSVVVKAWLKNIKVLKEETSEDIHTNEPEQ